MNFHVNLNFFDVGTRYAIVMVFGIVGALMNTIPIMLLALPFFITAILAWCPVYAMLGINHSPDKNECNLI